MSLRDNFKNKVVLITGGAKGIGAACAKLFSQNEATVVVVDIDNEALEQLKSEWKSTDFDQMTMQTDVTNETQVSTLMETISARFGGLDVLVNNAGGSMEGPKTLKETTSHHWDSVFGLNAKAVFDISRAALPLMTTRSEGAIVHITSIAARRPSLMTGPAYAAAKSALIGLTRHMANELGPSCIRVNSVAPGLVMSGTRIQDIWKNLTVDIQQKMLSGIPLGRFGEPEEIAEVVLFLSSSRASFITGVVLDVNGGAYMG
jgi:3-oxoacyl-[acyl-carrier protein] reductase